LTLRRARRSLKKRKQFRYAKYWSRMTAPATPSSSSAEIHTADRHLNVEGARLRYRDEGRGPTLILLHGWTLDLEMWDPQVLALRSEFRLVRFDRRGFGLSSGRPGAEHDAADIATLCRCLGLNRVAVIGMSQGARVALRFASLASERIYALILDGPPALDQSIADDEVPLTHLRAVMRTHGIAAFRREWSAHPLMQLRTPDPQMRELLDRMIARYPGHDLVGPEPASASVEPMRLPALRAPTLVLSGAQDLASRLQGAKLLSAQLPAAEHAVIHDAGHLINLDQPAVYSELCRSFLTRHANIAFS
jgi:3-oxoadipate enol-lactonase